MNMVGARWYFLSVWPKIVHNDGPMQRRIIVVQNLRIFFSQIWPFSSNLPTYPTSTSVRNTRAVVSL
jgi:hypothetical protein